VQYRTIYPNNGFESFWENYLWYVREEEKMKRGKKTEYARPQPPFITTYSELTPDVTTVFPNENSTYVEIVEPSEHKGDRITPFDENGYPIRFDHIDKLNEVLPSIRGAIPFKVN